MVKHALIVGGQLLPLLTHDLHIGCLLMFKKIAEKEFKVIIFNKSGCELVKQCSQHPENLMKKRVN